MRAKIEAWVNPINRGSAAMRDGRSKPPPAPDELADELMTRSINETLHSAYSIEQVLEMPYDRVIRLMLLGEVLQNSTNG